MQLQKESLKKSALQGFEPWPLRYQCSALTNWANKPTGSWTLNWFVIYPGKMKMKPMQLRKESLKKSGLQGFEPWPLRYQCSALTNWANKPTGSWTLNWFIIYPGKMKMKLWIYEIHIFELRNEEISVKRILAVINATYAVAKRKPEKIRLAGIRTLTSAIPVQRSN